MILIPLLRAGPHSIGQAGADHFLLHVSGKTDDEVKLQSELFACVWIRAVNKHSQRCHIQHCLENEKAA